MSNIPIVQIEGYAARYDEPDLNGDIIAPGAFEKTLRKRSAPVRMLYQHASETPIGRWTEFRSTAKGLIATGDLLLTTETARDVYALLSGGALDGLSIGYQTVRARKDRGAKGRRILEADLWEVSIVTFPMAPKARVTRIGAPARSANPSQNPHRIFSPPPPEDAARLEAGRSPSSSPRAFGLPPPNARLFADTLRDAASILSV